jgi:cysteine synthase A
VSAVGRRIGRLEDRRLLRGLGNSLLPANLDHTAFDEIHWVGAAEAFTATRRLHRAHALYMGPTSGAAWMVARWVAAREPDANVVVLMPDEGHRYQSTVGDDQWLRARGALLPVLPSDPRDATSLADVNGGWERMAWHRRTLAEALRS